MTSRSTSRLGSVASDPRREAELAAAEAGMTLDEWLDAAREQSFRRRVAAPATDLRRRASDRPEVVPAEDGAPVDRILSSLDKLGEKIRALSAEPRDAGRRPVRADDARDTRGRERPVRGGSDLTRAIEEIARRRDALERENVRDEEIDEAPSRLRAARTSAAGRDSLLDDLRDDLREMRRAMERFAEPDDLRPELRRLAERVDGVARTSVDGRTVAALRDDLQALRAAVLDNSAAERLQGLERAYDEIVHRLDQMRNQIDNPRVVADVVARLGEVRRLLAQAPTEAQILAVTDRLDDLTARVDAGLAGDRSAIADLERQVGRVAAQIGEFDTTGLLRGVTERLSAVGEQIVELERKLGVLDGFDRWQEQLGRHGTLLAQMAQRSEQLPRVAHEMERQSTALDGLSRSLGALPTIAGEITAVRRGLTDGATETNRGLAALAARLDDLNITVSALPVPDDANLSGQLAGIAARIEDLSIRVGAPAAPDTSAIEDRLAGIALAVEQLGARLPAELQPDPAGLRGQLDGIAQHLETLNLRLGTSAAGDSDAVYEQLSQIAGKLDGIAELATAPPAPAVGDLLAARLADVAGRLDRLQMPVAAPFDGDELLARLGEIADRLDDAVTRAPAGSSGFDASELSERLDAIAARLGELDPPAAGQIVDALEPRFVDLADLIETRIGSMAASLAEAGPPPTLVDSLLRIESQLADRSPDRRLTDIELRLEAIGEAVERSAPDLRQMEAALADIRGEIAGLIRPPTVDLEAELRTIANRMADFGSVSADLGGLRALEQRLTALVEEVSTRPSEATLVADALERFEASIRPALEARAPANPVAPDGETRAAIGQIRDDLGHLQDDLRGASRRDRDLLIAIAEAVEKLALREEARGTTAASPSAAAAPPITAGPDQDTWQEIERSLSENLARRPRRGVRIDPEPEPQIPAPEPVAEPPAKAAAPAAEDIGPDDTLDLDKPLEPGSGKPRPRPITAIGAAVNPAEVRKPDVSKADFIAAARRAAQAASGEQDSKKAKSAAPPVEQVAEAAATPRAPRSLGAALPSLGLLSRHKRKILVAVGAVVLVAAVSRLVVPLLFGGSNVPPATIGSAVETPAETGAESSVSQGVQPPADAPDAGAPAAAATDAPVEGATPPDATTAPAGEPGPGEVPPVAEGEPGPAAEAIPPAAAPDSATALAPAVAPPTSFGAAPGGPPADRFASRDSTAAIPPADAPSPAPSTTVDGLPPETVGALALRQAAAKGDPLAQFEVAARLTEGRGVAQDLAAAVVWYEKAAVSGLAPAQYRLGSLYEKGQGVARDPAKAAEWYGKAAAAGNAKAMHNLAVLNAEGGLGKSDYEAAARYFEQAANLGVRDSQYNLGILYARGLGVKRDLAASYKWFAIAAQGGDADAAKKRDDVAQVLDKDALARARLAVETWSAQPTDPAANDVVIDNPDWKAGDTTASVGDRNPIETAQTLLDRLGYDPGPADGKMGAKTREAIIAFQTAMGLKVTGEVDARLLKALAAQAI